MQPRHTARGIVLHDGQLLLMERWRPGKHYFSIPGGGIEAGETPEETAVRELAEETGCVVQPEGLLYTLRLADNTEHHIFLCTYLSGEPHLPPDAPEALAHNPDNRFAPRWVALEELPTLSYLVWEPVMKRFIQDLQSGLPEQPVQLASED